MIGIIGAMAIEIKHIHAKMQGITKSTIGGIDFYEGTLAGKKVLLALCGVGKVNAAHAASMMVTHFKTKCVINVGIAGGIAPQVGIGDVVIASSLVQHDVEATAFGYALGQVAGTAEAFWQACEELVKKAESAAKEHMQESKKLHTGTIATGDQFIHAPEAKESIWNNFSTLCVEMEGAAMAQVCTIAKVPFVAIRAISDKADGTAHEDFPTFAAETAELSSAIVMDMVGII